MVVDIKQHKSQFKNSNITIIQCQKNFTDWLRPSKKLLIQLRHVPFMPYAIFKSSVLLSV